MSSQLFSPIAVVSDVSLGFGSPQVQSLARSLASHYQATVTVYEPDQSGRPQMSLSQDGCVIHRVATEVNPHTALGRIEYIVKTATALRAQRPKVLVVFCTYCLPVLAKLGYRPETVIYSLIEMVAPYGESDVSLNRYLASHVDILVFPEENRARLDVARCGFRDTPLAIIYNVSDVAPRPHVPINRRHKRIFYGGSISTDLGLAEHFLRPEMSFASFDLFGDVLGLDQNELRDRISRESANLRYHGCVDGRTLAKIRRRFAYSIVMYRPSHEHTLYAAPNKFFEAVSDGVPPIVAPHPQCKSLVERYRCGIVMRDWSFEAFRDAVREALQIFGTPRYQRMVNNCEVAVREELNWQFQFSKLRKLLPEVA